MFHSAVCQGQRYTIYDRKTAAYINILLTRILEKQTLIKIKEA